MTQLTPGERRALRARAHHLQPVVTVGEAGPTPAVLHEIDVSLKSHELIKIRMHQSDRRARAACAGDISAALGAAIVQHIGKIAVFFRPRPADEGRTAPKRPVRRRPPRRTKRSYQME
jgi:putative YhbY family RNA-binding protein